MTHKKVSSMKKHRKNKKPPSLDDIARSVVKTYMEPMMSNLVEEPKGLAFGGFELDDKEDGKNEKP
jgi:hypothetical protein